jgi:hypothetical protein
VNRIGAKFIDTVRIDTTHFVCTEPRGQAWEKAVEMNVPVVVPDWVKGCEREGRIVGVRGYYLDADPKLRQMGTSAVQRSSVSTAAARDSPRIEHTPPTPERPTRNDRTFVDDRNSERPQPPPKPSTDSIPRQEASPTRGGDVPVENQSMAGSPLAHRPREDQGYSDEEYDDGNESDDTAKAIEQGREEAEFQPKDSVSEKEESEPESTHDSTQDSTQETTDGEAAKIAAEDGKGEFDEVAL